MPTTNLYEPHDLPAKSSYMPIVRGTRTLFSITTKTPLMTPYQVSYPVSPVMFLFFLSDFVVLFYPSNIRSFLDVNEAKKKLTSSFRRVSGRITSSGSDCKIARENQRKNRAVFCLLMFLFSNSKAARNSGGRRRSACSSYSDFHDILPNRLLLE